MSETQRRRSTAAPLLILVLVVVAVIELISFFRAKIAEEEREHTRTVLLERKNEAEARKRRDQVAKEIMEEYEASKRAKAP